MEQTVSNEQLLKKIAAGDEQAKEQFVALNKPLVISIVKRFSKGMIDEDLVSIGMVGLMKAINHFDPSYDCLLYTSRCV